MAPGKVDENPGVNVYKNSTLVANWWEDRYMPPGLKVSTMDRVFAMDLTAKNSSTFAATHRPDSRADGLPAAPGELAATTKIGMDEGMLNSLPPANVKKPQLFNSDNIDERLKAYGKPETLHYTLKGTETYPSDYERHLETTNTHFYSKLPTLDVTMAPTTRPSGYFDAPDRTHFNKNKLAKDTYDRTMRDPATETAGKGGQRGEISRNPGESGNVYGVAVFVDEYAKWGTALPARNMSLGESISRKTTKYFP